MGLEGKDIEDRERWRRGLRGLFARLSTSLGANRNDSK